MAKLNLNLSKEEDVEDVDVLNYTPHRVNIIDKGGEEIVTIEPEGEFPRLEENVQVAGAGGEVPIKNVGYGEVRNLPEPEEGVMFIVSTLTAMGSDRKDLLVPYDLVRDDGRIVGARSLARVR